MCESEPPPDPYMLLKPGGPLVFQSGYHPRKKIHVIRVVFSGPNDVRVYIV